MKGAERQRGSVLMLMPAGVLIVLMLGAIAFDLSLVFLRQRQTSSVAADVANDLATSALDEAAFRSTGIYQLDPDRADELGARLVRSSDIGDEVIEVSVNVLRADTVEVVVVVAVDYVFARAIPGAASGTTVRASAVAVATDLIAP